MEQGSSKQDACLAAGITAENLAYYTRRDPVLKRKVDLAMSKGGFRASNGSFLHVSPLLDVKRMSVYPRYSGNVTKGCQMNNETPSRKKDGVSLDFVECLR